MEDLFMIDKSLMRQIVEAIKSLKVDCNDFSEADKWVGIVLLLEQAMNPPAVKEETEEENG